MKLNPEKIRNMALIGLAIVVSLNIFGYLVLQQPAAELFAQSWWSTWAPSYLVWFVMLVVGFGGVLKQRNQ